MKGIWPEALYYGMFEWLSLYFASSFGSQGKLAPLYSIQKSKFVLQSAGKNVYIYDRLCPAFTILILTLAGGMYGTIYYQALAIGSSVAVFAFCRYVFVNPRVTWRT